MKALKLLSKNESKKQNQTKDTYTNQLLCHNRQQPVPLHLSPLLWTPPETALALPLHLLSKNSLQGSLASSNYLSISRS